jgi:hypothetical protein
MNIKEVHLCIFCGAETEEQHSTRIGLLYLHFGCTADLEEILSLTEEEMEGIKELT